MNPSNLPTEDKNGLYEIRLIGHLADRWIKHFGNVSITLEDNGITRLTASVVDQAALFGLLKKVRDCGLPLLSVNRIESVGNDLAEKKLST